MITNKAGLAMPAIVAVLSLLLPFTASAAEAATGQRADAPAQQITVNLADGTGPVFHGASGALYGLSEDGVPGADLFSPLHVTTIAAKPPGGLQHPTGDADKVLASLVPSGA